MVDENKEELKDEKPEDEKKVEAKQEQEEEYNVKAEIENLKKAVAELSIQVAMIKEAWDRLLEEEANEEDKSNPVDSALKGEDDKAEFSKQLSELKSEINMLRAQLSNYGVKKTVQSSNTVRDEAEIFISEYLREKNLI